ncbi:MAG: transposase [Chloroflexi bacterium]|nr:transposase [Chloroflexota bacterium]
MTDKSIVTQLPLWAFTSDTQKLSVKPPELHTLATFPQFLPTCVTASPTIRRYLDLLSPLDWAHFPERNLQRHWRYRPVPHAALAVIELIRLNEAIPSMEKLRRFLLEHPGFIWLCGFPLVLMPDTDLSFNPRASLPTARHLTDMLRTLPNAALQFLLTDSVRLIQAELHVLNVPPIDCVSLDTKHILAWVKENNPKAYVTERYNKHFQPLGDPDCRLGCKRKHNRPTPTNNPTSAASLAVGEYYWGYGSGIVVAKVPAWGEFVLAELTQPFDQGDATYFFPLMQQVEERVGNRPRYGTFDAAFDAWYVYAHFYRENQPDFGFAAVPFSEKGNYKAKERQFDSKGLPLCKAGFAMPLKLTFRDRTKCLVEHERGMYVCPLQFPTRAQSHCPIHHPTWKRGGCNVQMPTSIGARLRHTLDRDSERYKDVYRQRTATERIHSQAVALGIERPRLRNGAAIANQNTLIYLLINLRFLQRLRKGRSENR